MISSGDIAQMFAQQNQMFMQRNSFAQNIGIAPPSASLGGFGNAPRPPNMGSGTPFSYGPQGFAAPSMGPGNAFAGNIMSAGGAALGGMGLGVASMWGPLKWMSPLVDPLGGAFNGFMAGGLRGAAAGAALPLAFLGATSHMVGQTMAGGQQQAQVNAGLGQFNFLNPNSRTGMGFNRQDASGIGEQIRSLATLPEMLSSMEELTRLLPKLKANGTMQGVKDATEFSRRFKESIGTIRDLSKVLGTTMEDAEQFFSHSRSIGFLGRGDQLKNAMNAQLTSGVTGLNSGQVMQLQTMGAGMARGMGGNIRMGAMTASNIAQNVGLAQMAGIIAPGQLEEATGMLGTDAIAGIAQQMSGLALNFGRTPAGMLAMSGLLNKAGTGLDHDMVKRMNAGLLSPGELRSRGMGLSNSQKMAFVARMPDIASELAAAAGPGGMAQMLGDVTGASGDKLNVMLQKMGGLDFGQADIAMRLRGVGSGQEGNQMAGMRSREILLREKTDTDAILKRIKTRIHNQLSEPFNKLGAAIHTYIGQEYDNFIDDAVGRHTLVMSDSGAKAFERAISGGSSTSFSSMRIHSDPSAPSRGLGQQFMDSGIMSFLNKGGLNTGMSSGGDSAEISGLVGSGSFYSGSASSSTLNKLKMGIDNFRDKSELRKLRDLNDAVEGKIGLGTLFRGKSVKDVIEKFGGMKGAVDFADSLPRDIGTLMKTGLAGPMNADYLTSISMGGNAASASSLRINAGGDSDSNYTSIANASIKKREAEQELGKAGFKESLSLLASSPSARKAVLDSFRDDGVFKAIMDGSDEALKQAVQEAHRGDSSEVIQAITNYDRVSNHADVINAYEVMKGVATDINSSINDSKGASKSSIDAWKGISSALESKDFKQTTSAIKKAIGMAQGMSGKDRAAFLDIGGEFGKVMGRSLGLGLKENQHVSIDMLRNKLQLSKEVLIEAGIAPFGDTVLDSKKIADLESAFTAVKGVNLKGGTATSAGAADVNIEKTLKAISTLSTLQSTAIIAAADIFAAFSKDENLKSRLKNAEIELANANGTTKIQGK